MAQQFFGLSGSGSVTLAAPEVVEAMGVLTHGVPSRLVTDDGLPITRVHDVGFISFCFTDGGDWILGQQFCTDPIWITQSAWTQFGHVPGGALWFADTVNYVIVPGVTIDLFLIP